MDTADETEDEHWHESDAIKAHLLMTYASYGLGVIMFLFAALWARGGSPLRVMAALAGFVLSAAALSLFIMPGVQKPLERWLIRHQELKRARKRR